MKLNAIFRFLYILCIFGGLFSTCAMGGSQTGNTYNPVIPDADGNKQWTVAALSFTITDVTSSCSEDGGGSPLEVYVGPDGNAWIRVDVSIDYTPNGIDPSDFDWPWNISGANLSGDENGANSNFSISAGIPDSSGNCTFSMNGACSNANPSTGPTVSLDLLPIAYVWRVEPSNTEIVYNKDGGNSLLINAKPSSEVADFSKLHWEVTISGTSQGVDNPVYGISWSSDCTQLTLYSYAYPGAYKFKAWNGDGQEAWPASNPNDVNVVVKYTPDMVCPADDATGSRYRKIGLNGRPMPDNRPHQEAETDEQKEETYVDALTLGLRHSTTDIYIPIPGSTLSLSVRRNIASEDWNDNGGLRPAERLDRPFGACWTSNLSPTIDYTYTKNRDTPDTFYVTDESGSRHRFIYAVTGSNSTGGYNVMFCPVPTAGVESTYECGSLAWNGKHLVYTGKFGNVISFEQTLINRYFSSDRKHGGDDTESHTYYRATSIVDRVGTEIDYSYSDDYTVIPASIYPAKNPSQRITITSGIPTTTGPTATYEAGNYATPAVVVTSIKDPKGNTWDFNYESIMCSDGSLRTTDGACFDLLTSVTKPDNSSVRYSYETCQETDTRNWLPGDYQVTQLHCDLRSITTQLGMYGFSYNLDQSKRDHSEQHGYYQKTGLPRNVSTVTLPNGSQSRFQNNSLIGVYEAPLMPVAMMPGSYRGTMTWDPLGNRTEYNFTNPCPLEAQLDESLGYSKSSRPVTIYYQTMSVSYPYGTETYTFDRSANMALSSATDICGNTTQYAHTEAIAYATGTSPLQQIFQGSYNLAKYYDDPSSQTNDAGTKSFEYGPWRIMRKSVDELGRTTVNTVDAQGRRLDETVTDANGTVLKETAFRYDNSSYPGALTKKTLKRHQSDPAWVTDIVTDYSLDAAGNVASETTYAGGQPLVTAHTYDANNNKLTSTDPNGNTTAFAYDSLNRLSTTTFADNTTKSFAYDSNGNKIRETDENGHVTKNVYDSLNRLTEIHKVMGTGLADLVTKYEYNDVNSKTKVTDPNGNVTTTDYDAMQRPIRTIAPATSFGGALVCGTTTLEYGTNSGGSVFDSSAFKPTKATDPNGTVTEVTYDALYRPLTHTVTYSGTMKAVTTTAYDAVGNPVQTSDAVGNLTQTIYDGLNRPVQVTYCKPDGTAMASTATTYTSTGLKWQVSDELGNVAETRYDSAGRPVIALAPAVDDGHGTIVSGTTQTLYDAAGNAIGVINPLGNQTDYGFNSRNRRIWELAPAVVDATQSGTVMVRPLKQTAYDAVGKVIAVTDHLTGVLGGNGSLTVSGSGAETDTVYDAVSRPISVTGPAVADPLDNNTLKRPSTLTAYDANGNVTRVTDPLGHVTVNTYDALNRLITTTDAANIQVSYEYDLVGNRTKVTDGKGNATVFTYDGLKRNTSVTDALGQATVFVYDGQNKIQRTDAMGHITQYAYDYRNRLATVSYPARTGDNRIYAYDLAGNLLGVSEPGKNGVADAAYTYDALKRIVTETSNGVTHSYSYDLAGNRLQTVYGNNGKTIVSTYDAFNRLSTMSESGRISGYGYDIVGNIAVKTAPNGDKETAAFDLLNRTTSQTAISGTNLLYQYTYEHDLAGNVTKVGENYAGGLNNRTVNNTYDAINRLSVEAVSGSNAVTTAYTYDAANNRLSKVVTGGSNAGTTGYTYNALNQLTQYSDSQQAVALSYDANGNRATRTVTGGTASGVDTYGYDYENRLVTLAKGAGAVSGTYEYVYDYRTRRVVRDETAAGGVSTNVVFSGGLSVQEYAAGSTYASVEYIRGSDYGGGVGGILYTLRGSDASFTHENRRGDVIAKTDASGVLTYQACYEAYGTRTQENGSTQDRQKANTKDEDPTGLLNEGFRYRDLETGGFITADPTGFKAGPNFYTYVSQNPWTKFDPEGLDDGDSKTPPPPPPPPPEPPKKDPKGSPSGSAKTDSEQGKSILKKTYDTTVSAVLNGVRSAIDGVGFVASLLPSDGTGNPQPMSYSQWSGELKQTTDKIAQSLGVDTNSKPYETGNTIGAMAGVVIGVVDGGGEGQILSRLGKSRESAARLGRKAAEAEEKIGIHGVSTTAGEPIGPASQASREAVETKFTVHDTPTHNDPMHCTVELPKPVTPEVAKDFNQVFGR